MSVRRALLAVVFLAAGASPGYAAEPSSAPRVGPPAGTLLIVGGGSMGGL